MKIWPTTRREVIHIILTGVVTAVVAGPVGWWYVNWYLSRYMKMHPHTRVVFANITMNGQPAHMSLDTGAEMTNLWNTGAQRLGLKFGSYPHQKPEAPVKGGEIERALSEPVRMMVGTETFTAPLEIVIGSSEAGWGSNLEGEDGVIGWPEVRDDILVFDGAKRTVSSVEELPPETAGWLKLKIHSDGKLLLETPMPEGKTGVILVDTGSESGVELLPLQWKEWKAAHPQATVTAGSYQGPLVGEGTTERASADEVKLGPLTLTDVRAEETSEALVTDISDYAGTLGIFALERMDFIVDGKNGFAYLRPKPPVSQPQSGDGDNTSVKNDPAKDPAETVDWKVADNVRLRGDGLFISSGEYKLESNDLSGAIADYTQALKLDPNNSLVYRKRGYAERRAKDYPSAIADYTKEIEFNPKNAQACINRAAVKEDQGDREGAIADYTLALEIDPKNVNAYNNRAIAKHAKSDDDGAIADYDQAIELSPKDSILYDNRGDARDSKGNYDGAIADYSKAIEFDPKNAGFYVDRGEAKKDQGDHDGAIADYNYALNLDSKDSHAYIERGFSKDAKGDYDGAIADDNRALEIDPKNATAYNNRGYARHSKGDDSGAMADFNHAIEIDPKDAFLHKSRGAVRQLEGDSAGALEDYDEAIKLKPGDTPYSHLYRQFLLIEMGKTPPDLTPIVAGWKDGWSTSLGQFVTGKLDENALLAVAQKRDEEPVSAQQCEAYYVIGMMRLLKDDKAGARDFFQKSLATKETSYDEYLFAKAELARLDGAEKK